MPYTISANTHTSAVPGKSRLLLDIPSAASISNFSVTDVSTSSTSHYAFSGYERRIIGQPGDQYRLLVTMLTTRPTGGPAPATSGSIRVQYTYVDLGGMTRVYDSGPLAAYFVTAETLVNHPWDGEPQVLAADVGGEQELVIPVTGLCSVKSGVMSDGAGSSWTLAMSGQTPTSLWATATYNFTLGEKTVTAGEGSLLSVTLTAEDDVGVQCTPFLFEVFHAAGGGGNG